MSRSPGARKFEESQKKLLVKHGTKAISRYFSLKELKIKVHLLEVGEGEPVLLIHGGGAMAISWEPLLSLLQHHFHLYVPDLPGCGLTEKINYRGLSFREYAIKFVESVLAELGIQKISLIGNSIGGYWGIVFSLACPEAVKKLVLIGAPSGIDKWAPLLLRLFGIPVFNRFLYATIAKPSLKGIRDLFQLLLVANIDRISPEYLECTYLNSMLPGSGESWLSMLEEVVTPIGWNIKYYIRDELMNLQQPILFIWGDKDAFAPPSSGEEACKMMPNARMKVISNAGHLPWLDEPEQCAELIINFLR